VSTDLPPLQLLLDSEPAFVVPARAPRAARPPFPLLGSLAPLPIAAVLWIATHSPLALVFALLSPVIAIASLLDGSLHARRARRRDERTLVDRRTEFVDRVRRYHDAERAELERLAPSAARVLEGHVRGFVQSDPARCPIRLGSADGRSSIRLSGTAAVDDGADDDAGLRTTALTLSDAPVLARGPVRIAVVGPPSLAHAVARGYAVQLAAAVAPTAARWRWALRDSQVDDDPEWGWAQSLPHRGAVPILLGRALPDAASSGAPFIVVASSEEQVPPEATVLVRVGPGSTGELLRHPESAVPRVLNCEFVSVSQASAAAGDIARRARSTGLTAPELPRVVLASEIATQNESAVSPSDGLSSLDAIIGLSEHGDAVSLDLVSQGPHAVVGGTTGSGKSELLVTWIASLARRHPPSAFTVLLVDFKGGSSFDSLTTLDHCIGLITDLDPAEASRALSSLTAEIRFRERVLRQTGARDIADPAIAGRLARLVIVVDEFAAMITAFPALHDVFADIAARGRSLGMHLVLCTQRPAGVVRDSLMANCELRLSLRVNNAGDSLATIGSPAASMLDPALRGRCYLATGGTAPLLLQVAVTGAADIEAIDRRGTGPERRPWLPPLPATIPLSSIPAPPSGVVLGMLDEPHEQRQSVALFNTGAHAPLLVLGSARSGKSTLLRTVQTQQRSALLVPREIEGAWDAIARAADACVDPSATGSGPARLVLIDDIDSMLRGFEPDYQAELLSRLTRILRDGPSRGLTVIATAQRLAAPLSSLAALFPERMLLRHSSRQEYLLAEGEAAQHDAALPPGAGHWRGTRIQLALPDDVDLAVAPPLALPPTVPLPAALIVVCARPALYLDASGWRDADPAVRLMDASDRAQLASFGDRASRPVGPVRLVGDPDTWLSSWSVFSSLRQTTAVLFDGCSVAEYRSLTRRRELPPPLDGARSGRWLLEPNGTVRRA
jgi:S-DNA-T family DNA segregation ATPase FtsK/SpoIIIE